MMTFIAFALWILGAYDSASKGKLEINERPGTKKAVIFFSAMWPIWATFFLVLEIVILVLPKLGRAIADTISVELEQLLEEKPPEG